MKCDEFLPACEVISRLADVATTGADYGLPEEYRPIYSGKVRDLFEGPDGHLLFVASDRISAFDHVLPTLIPDKGRILTALSVWWFERLADLVPNHLISLDVPEQVKGRAMVCKRLEIIPIECVARGYLTGSGFRDYLRTGVVGGNALPPGIEDGAHLPEPIFSPATKAPIGWHDLNIDYATVEQTIGPEAAYEMRRLTLAIYTRAEGIARGRGMLLADTKFEFGRDPAVPDQLVLADEVLTPDSSRYWPIEEWRPGETQRSFDKQYLRDWLTSPASGWDKESDSPPPELPEAIVEQTREKYADAYERLTGVAF